MSRSTPAGPVAGAYAIMVLEAAPANSLTDAPIGEVILPANCRIVEIGIRTGTLPATLTNIKARLNGINGATNLLSADPAPATVTSTVITPTSSPSLVAAQRNRTKGDVISFSATTPAGAGTYPITITLTVYLSAYGSTGQAKLKRTGAHVVALSKND